MRPYYLFLLCCFPLIVAAQPEDWLESLPALGKAPLDAPSLTYQYSPKQTLLLQIVNHRLVLTTLDKKGKVTAPISDKVRVRLIHHTNAKKDPLILVLKTTPEGHALYSPRYLRPPNRYRITLFLVDPDTNKHVKRFEPQLLTP